MCDECTFLGCYKLAVGGLVCFWINPINHWWMMVNYKVDVSWFGSFNIPFFFFNLFMRDMGMHQRHLWPMSLMLILIF